jgi:hypothetical protein
MFTIAPITNLGQSIEVATAPQPRRLEISLARSRSDLIGAFQILYNAYVRAGLASENPHMLRLSPYHLLPTTEVFVAKLGDTVTSTMTLVFDSDAGLPMDAIYHDEISKLREAGCRIAEIGCLADRRKSAVRFIKVFGEFARLLAQVTRLHEIDSVVVATHPRHAGFYERSFGFRQLGELKTCPYVKNHPAVALIFEFERVRNTPLYDCLLGGSYDQTKLTRPPRDQETIRYLQSVLESFAS